jgi:hypothetical protein
MTHLNNNEKPVTGRHMFDLLSMNTMKDGDLSDIAKEDVITIDSKSSKNNTESSMEATTVVQQRWWKNNPLKDLDNLESNPREFSNIKKRLVLMTVALASSM